MPSELSGGMRKRIGLARTLILKPEILIRRTNNGTRYYYFERISELVLEIQKKNKTSSIIITHDMCIKHTADRLVILKEGIIHVEGTYEELEKVMTNGFDLFLYNQKKIK
jgi:phospholipid/cholesterol/gamma-HCH transport system ATP-binding protein